MTEPILDIQNLFVGFSGSDGRTTTDVVKGVDLTLNKGETVGIVGESGSGKTMTMLAASRLLPRQARVTAGSIRLNGQDLSALDDTAFHREVSGKRIAMIFQEPMTALNPVYTVGRQLTEAMRLHGGKSRAEARARALEMLNAVRMPNPEARLRQYPHQLSGGQRQRVMIAMALMNRPDILIADEPTTALDVTVQNEIIELLIELQERLGMAMVFISHDLGVVSRVAERIVVMRQGEIVETGATSDVLTRPSHDYTIGLLKCLWKLDDPPSRQDIAETAPLIEVEDISKTYHLRESLLAPAKVIHAVKGARFDVRAGETLAIVGESGSGKSTLAKIMNGLLAPDAGEVRVDGVPVASISLRDRARLIQPIFQDPYSTLNPNQTIGYIVGRPLLVHGEASGADLKRKTIAALGRVGLPPEFYNRFPNQLSGGQRQRVAIARALILNPRILICDEPTSALDVSIQEQVLDLLQDLQAQLGVTLILISHDMAVVGYMADRVLVMLNGEIVERGQADAVLDNPQSDYAARLMASVYRVPRPDGHEPNLTTKAVT